MPRPIHVRPDEDPKLWLKRIHSSIPPESLPQPIIAPFTTTSRAITIAASKTQAAVDNMQTGLNLILHGEAIWRRAWSYVNPEPFDSAVPDTLDLRRCWDCPSAPDAAPPLFDHGLQLLRNIILTNKSRFRPILTNNFSAKDTMDMYIFDVIEAVLQVSITFLPEKPSLTEEFR